MQWFKNQVKERRRADQERLEDSFAKISGVVLGQRIADRMNDQRFVTKSAIDEILKYYHCKPSALPDSVTESAASMRVVLFLLKITAPSCAPLSFSVTDVPLSTSSAPSR